MKHIKVLLLSWCDDCNYMSSGQQTGVSHESLAMLPHHTRKHFLTWLCSPFDCKLLGWGRENCTHLLPRVPSLQHIGALSKYLLNEWSVAKLKTSRKRHVPGHTETGHKDVTGNLRWYRSFSPGQVFHRLSIGIVHLLEAMGSVGHLSSKL